tara:strand:- start:15334 stop:16818 length:1485 start_codon:yes stop_codon:yes gene_type:complete
MGYGGIIKTVVRVAASVVGGMACGPPCAAIGSAVATGATGGSFKEALIAGATSYIGSSISQGVSGSISEAGKASELAGQIADGTATVTTDAAGSTIIIGNTVGTAGDILASGDLAAAAADPSFITSSLAAVGEATAPINTGVSEFLTSNFGDVGGVVRTGYDFLANEGAKTLGQLGFDTAAVPFDIVGGTVGGLTELTLNQALNADVPGLDDVLSQKFTPQQIAALRQEARNALSQEAFDRLIGDTINPGLSDEEFRKVIAAGIERENVGLGADVTEPEFRQVFDNPDLGRLILADEEGLRRQTFGEQIGETFPGGAFKSLDDSIIQSIVDERAGPARQQVSNLQARGSLNPIGGQQANLFLSGQEEGAKERVREIEQGVLGGAQRDVNLLRGQAETGATGYRLGDDLFDIKPFAEQREKLVTERQGSLGEDVRSAIGSEPLFDISGALRTGSRAQGPVSGAAPNQSFLDAIAAREGSGGRDKRGLGTRGSGAF